MGYVLVVIVFILAAVYPGLFVLACLGYAVWATVIDYRKRHHR